MTLTSSNPTFEEVCARRMTRRGALKAMLVAGAGTAATVVGLPANPASAADLQTLTFNPVDPYHTADWVLVADDYVYDLVIRWGDPLLPASPALDLNNQNRATQEQQFGFNCDYTAFIPLRRADHGLLVVNHEYTEGERMFPGYSAATPTADQIDAGLAGHGLSVVEVIKDGQGRWTYLRRRRYNRRITAFTTMTITGPAAASPRVGTTVDGTLNNCGGGVTPWGTVLTAEENFDQYFANRGAVTDPYAKALHDQYPFMSVGASERKWETRYPRFDVSKPEGVNEPLKFGYVVEVDPLNPDSVPKKRTALGRFKHEAAFTVLAPSGEAVVYSGDDERNQFVYKFVTSRPVNLRNPAANDGLLDEGTLYAAKFNDDGSGIWLPLVAGQGPLTPANGFASQTDVCIDTRRAARLLGATPMDRPEDIDASPVTAKVYIALTNNSERGQTGRPGTDAVNPRPDNRAGHIIELTEASDDSASSTFRWEIFLLCGDPALDPTGNDYTPGTVYPNAPTASRAETYFAGFDKSQVSPLGAPDNLAFDRRGNLWITTDGMPSAFRALGHPANKQSNDAILGVATRGADRGQVKKLLGAVPGCEMTGPYFTPDDTSLFACVQHPGENGTLAAPQSTWPSQPPNRDPLGRGTFVPEGPAVARPSVIAVRRNSNSPNRTIGYDDTAPPPVIPEFSPPVGLAVAGAAAAGLIAFRNRQVRGGGSEAHGPAQP